MNIIRDLPDKFLVAFCPRTRANGIHDLMLREAARYASETDRVTFFESSQLFGLLIDDILAIRMKKMDEDSRSRSQRTRQLFRFRNQIPIDCIGAMHHLELGYVTNDAATEIAEIRLACPNGPGVSWWMRLNPDGGQAVVVDMFTSPEDESDHKPAKIGPKKSTESGLILPFPKQSNDEN